MADLWKVDTRQWTVRNVTGAGCFEPDSEGDTIFSNTHYPDAAQAWDQLRKESRAFVILSARAVVRAREDLQEAERKAAQSTVIFAAVEAARDEFVAGADAHGNGQA